MREVVRTDVEPDFDIDFNEDETDFVVEDEDDLIVVAADVEALS